MDATLEELAALANAAHARVEDALRATIRHAKEAGDPLIAARAKIPHGGWTPWLKENFRGSAETARVYMRIARHWDCLQHVVAKQPHFTIQDAREFLRPEPEPGGPNGFPPWPDVLRTDLKKRFASAMDTSPDEVVVGFANLWEPCWLAFDRLLRNKIGIGCIINESSGFGEITVVTTEKADPTPLLREIALRADMLDPYELRVLSHPATVDHWWAGALSLLRRSVCAAFDGDYYEEDDYERRWPKCNAVEEPDNWNDMPIPGDKTAPVPRGQVPPTANPPRHRSGPG